MRRTSEIFDEAERCYENALESLDPVETGFWQKAGDSWLDAAAQAIQLDRLAFCVEATFKN